MEFNEVSKILRDVFLRYGNELFTNEKRLKAVLSDILPSFPKEKRLMEYAIDESIVAIIAQQPESYFTRIYTGFSRTAFGYLCNNT